MQRPGRSFTVSADGGEARRLTAEGNNSRPRWSPDSGQLAFVSDRTDSSQIWLMEADGSRQRPVTDLPVEVDGVLFSPAGDTLVFAGRVYPDCGADWQCNKSRLARDNDGRVQARVYDSLPYRHWDAWDDGRRSHLFALAADASPGSGDRAVELTPGEYDVPPFSLSAPEGYALSPDGLEVAYARASDGAAESGLALSTDTDLYAVSIRGGDPVRLTDNPAFDGGPVYSPDGLYIAYLAQQRAGYESDRFRLMLYDRESGETAVVTETFDRWVNGAAWSSDAGRLFLTAEDRGREPIFTVLVSGGGVNMAVYGDASHGDVQLLPDGKSLIYTAQSGSHPVEIFRGFAGGGAPLRLTHENDAILDRYRLPDYEEIRYASNDGSEVSGFLLKPPNFDLDGAYPLLLLIHGGPQGAWRQSWSYRWNAQVFAAAGFVVFMPNPRGSTGYGQAFIDGINADWGRQGRRGYSGGVGYGHRAPVYRPQPRGRRGRIVRRLHGQLAAGPFGAVPGARLPCGHLRSGKLFRGDGRTVVPLMGVRGRAVGEAGALRAVVAERRGREVQDAHAGDPRPARLPRAGGAGHGAFYGAADEGCSVQVPALPGRRPLDSQAGQQRAVVRHVLGWLRQWVHE